MKHIFLGISLLAPVMAFAQHPNPEMSILEIYDVETKTHQVIKEFSDVIEAPNWSPDGKWLLLNKNGKLYKLAADGKGELQEVNTGTINRANNDHVISADGKMIGMSSSDPNEKRYNSYVYFVPVEGGEPHRITPLGPSYLHGISPDGKWAAYCAFRGPNQEQDVWVMPVKGGKEIRLTDAPGLDDGPEYSMDGKYIWFNSVRSGRMQAWRMKANGKEQTQMTFDEDMNSWFPHISPDGKKVVYIAYHDYEIDPGSHVADLNVQLRMIPAQGGQPETLLEMFGGQGSINVNSWSPDSKKFAFIRYRLLDEINAPKKNINLQLHVLHNQIGTHELFAQNHPYVLERLIQMGYTGVEMFGYDNGQFLGYSPTEMAGIMKKAGLTMMSSLCRHTPSASDLENGRFQETLSWWDQCIAAHKAAGIPNIVYINNPEVQSEAQIKSLANLLNAIGDKCKAAGITFHFHNGMNEVGPMGDSTKLEYLIQHTDKDKVSFELDTFWTVRGGVSPVALLQKYPGRFALVHISDQDDLGKSGMVGFEPIFNAFAKAGVKDYVVDIDHTSTPNALKGVRESALFLRHADYVK